MTERLLGASSTTMLDSGTHLGERLHQQRLGDRVRLVHPVGRARSGGVAWGLGAGPASRSRTRGRLLVITEVPSGVQAAVAGSSIS